MAYRTYSTLPPQAKVPVSFSRRAAETLRRSVSALEKTPDSRDAAHGIDGTGGRHRTRAGNDDRRRVALRDIRGHKVRRCQQAWLDGLGGSRFAGRPRRILCGAKKKYQPWADLAGSYGLDIFQIAGSPCKNYELLLGLYANAERVDIRHSHATLRAIQDSFAEKTPQEYFLAMSQTSEEGEAAYNLHEARVAIRTRNDGRGD